MATHKEIRQNKTDACNFVYDLIRFRQEVKINDFSIFFGDIWKNPAVFIQEVKKNAPNDITIITKRRVGTVGIYTPEKAERIALIAKLPEIVEKRQKELIKRTVHGRNKKQLELKTAIKKIQLAKINKPKRDAKGRFIKVKK